MAVPICAEADPGVDAGHRVVAGGQEDGVHAAIQRVPGQQRGDGGAEALAARRRQHAHAGNLRHPVHGLAASGRERPVRAERRGQHRMPGPQPFPQHLDRAAVVVRGDLVPLDRAGFPGRGARMPERHRGHRPDPVQFGIFGRDHAHRDAGRERRCAVRRRGQHHQRVRLHLQARLGRGRRHLGRGLLDPLEGLGDDQLALPGADGADVGGGDARPGAGPWAGRSTASPGRWERRARAARARRPGPGAVGRRRRTRQSAQ